MQSTTNTPRVVIIHEAHTAPKRSYANTVMPSVERCTDKHGLLTSLRRRLWPPRPSVAKDIACPERLRRRRLKSHTVSDPVGNQRAYFHATVLLFGTDVGGCAASRVSRASLPTSQSSERGGGRTAIDGLRCTHTAARHLVRYGCQDVV